MCGRGTYLVVALVLTSAALLAVAQVPAEAQGAKITAVVLDVTHRAGANGTFVKSGVGAQLPPGSRVRTGKRSKCEIKFPSGSIIRMGERSDLLIQQATDVQLGYGRIYAKIIAGTAATVSGTTATAGVLGTEFEYIGIREQDQELPPNQRHEILRVYAGRVLLSNAAGERNLAAGMATGVIGGFQPGAPVPTPPPQFPGGQRQQWWGGVRPGLSVQASPGGTVGEEIHQERQTTQTVETTVVPPPEEGSVDVIVTSLSSRHRTGLSGMDLLTAATSWRDPEPETIIASAPLGTYTVQSASQAATAQPDPGVELFGKRFFGPTTTLDTFGFWAEGGGLLGALPRVTGVWGDIYLQASALLATDFGDDTVELDETYAAARPHWGEVVAGRQRFLDGPINNTPVGALLPFDCADALRVDYRAGDALKVSGAWFESWTPLIGTETSGAWLRAEQAWLGGTAGGTWLHQSGADHEGWMLDVALPAVPGELDAYLQAGTDPDGRNLGTAGIYLPGLYRREGVDAFVEYAWRDGLPGVWSLRAYQTGEAWDSVALLQTEVGGDTTVGIGAVAHFGD